MDLNNGLTKDARIIISGALSKVLADTYVLYVKTQNFHWNIHGPEFYSLHKLSQEHYEDMAEGIDEIAERIRALGFFVEGSMEAFLKVTSIKEDHQVNAQHTYIEHLIEAHEAVIRACRAADESAGTHGDGATNDLMGRRLGMHEKAVWMLKSQLQ